MFAPHPRFVIKTKISPIPSGRDAEAVAKSAAKGIGALETNGGGDGVDREVLGRQTSPRLIQPAVLYEGAGRLTEGGLKTSDEMARGKTGATGQGHDREIALRVGCDPAG
jgi:hypothetical protein